MKQYIADAFTEQVFAGNPAAVCVTEAWLPDAWMQQIAAENNLSETAFTVKDGDHYCLRWFTPKGEIDFCGHATLAAAYILLRFYEPDAADCKNMPSQHIRHLCAAASCMRKSKKTVYFSPAMPFYTQYLIFCPTACRNPDILSSKIGGTYESAN
ncbi:MAG TPA: hypothetical protein DCG49_03980 [Ruminococcus sp.]|nr:hypothetical protein [Ruminococcus sp.]